MKIAIILVTLAGPLPSQTHRRTSQKKKLEAKPGVEGG